MGEHIRLRCALKQVKGRRERQTRQRCTEFENGSVASSCRYCIHPSPQGGRIAQRNEARIEHAIRGIGLGPKTFERRVGECQKQCADELGQGTSRSVVGVFLNTR